LLFDNDVREIAAEISAAGIVTMGTIEPEHFVWPVNRDQALRLLEFFAAACLPLFGTYQDAMAPDAWSMYHSRLSFALNVKLISPKEVIDRVIKEYYARPQAIEYHQLEGFVRQIIGWREYMRGIYWLKMPEYASLNFFVHEQKLPIWYWSGQTKMNCLKHSIAQSLTHAYAHHIQRLMVTGNFALLAGVHPDEVDQWYLGIYIDALDWVEITNTRGMSQFADGGLVATKPYVSSAAYIDKMSHYCSSCYYKKQLKTGNRACPFNSLYWHFLARNEALLKSNTRMRMMYTVWYKTNAMQRKEILEQAEKYLSELDQL
jgi:deoxyribodipyrimidine photolyase-related protein